MIITKCRQCDGYTILPDQEAEGCRAAIQKLRLNITGSDRGAVIAQLEPIRQLHLEIEMLLAAADIDVHAVPMHPAVK